MIARTCLAAGLAMTALVLAAPVRATTWSFLGLIEFCDPLACTLAGIGEGDELVGFLEAVDEVSGPDSTFTEADVTDYLLVSGAVQVGPEDSSLDDATLSTDSEGELVSGFAVFTGTFDGGVFGPIDLLVTLDVTAGTWTVETDFLNLGVVASGTGGFTLAAPDSDADGLADDADNCIADANALQEDNDADGIGDICDADFDQNCNVNFTDLGEMKANFFATGDLVTDMNNDDATNFVDLGLLKGDFFMAPGPSGIPNLCSL